MEEKGNTIRTAILSWTRFKYKLTEMKKDKSIAEEDVRGIEDYLKTKGIEDLNIIYKSPDYYMVRYLKDGKRVVQEYNTEEIENIL